MNRRRFLFASLGAIAAPAVPHTMKDWVANTPAQAEFWFLSDIGVMWCIRPAGPELISLTAGVLMRRRAAVCPEGA